MFSYLVSIWLSFSSHFNNKIWYILGNPVHSGQEVMVFRTRAANSIHESLDRAKGEMVEKKNNAWATISLGFLFGIWYLFNIYFNIYVKEILKVYPFPITITTIHLGMGTIFVLFMWATNLHKRPKVSSSQLMAILPLAIVHTLGNLFTNISLGKVSINLTHTIKALEPFFSVLLSIFFLGEKPSFLVLGSLVSIVGGVGLASFTEASFNWVGFWNSMASNLANQSRNVLSKGLMESVDNITLFSVITVMSFLLLAPFSLLTEGIDVITPSHLVSQGLNLREICIRTLLAGFCFHAYQQVAYMILARVSPVTHSVGNCVKRVVVILASVLIFNTPISLINALGNGAALVGILMYSRVTVTKVKRKTKSA